MYHQRPDAVRESCEERCENNYTMTMPLRWQLDHAAEGETNVPRQLLAHVFQGFCERLKLFSSHELKEFPILPPRACHCWDPNLTIPRSLKRSMSIPMMMACHRLVDD